MKDEFCYIITGLNRLRSWLLLDQKSWSCYLSQPPVMNWPVGLLLWQLIYLRSKGQMSSRSWVLYS